MSTGSVNPGPRPALRRAPDGGVHPAAPRPSTLRAELPAVRPDDGRTKSAGKRGKPAKGAEPQDKTVELTVVLSKSLRRRLREKAAEHGYTPEEAAAHLLRVWVDG